MPPHPKAILAAPLMEQALREEVPVLGEASALGDAPVPDEALFLEQARDTGQQPLEKARMLLRSA